MRNFNSSLAPWIGLILVSSAWLACHAYPDGRVYRNPDHTIERRDASSVIAEKTDASDSLHRPHYPTEEQSIHNAWQPAKRHVSMPVRNLEMVETRKIRDTSSIGDESDEEELANSDVDMKLLDDLPEMLKQTIEEDKKDSDLQAVPNETNDVMDCFAKISNALYSTEFWNGIAQRLTHSAVPEALRSFLGFPPIDILQIGENAVRQKRQTTWLAAPVGAATPVASVSQIIQQFMPATATVSQQEEMRRCVYDATTELQNLLNQFRTACSNIRDNISVGPPANCHKSSSCQNPSFIQSAPVLIQSILENPEQIAQIPEILQSSVPSSQMSHSIDKLKGSLTKIFGLLQEFESESEEDCEEESGGKKQKFQKSNKHSRGRKSKKSSKLGNNEKGGKQSSNRRPNTVIVTIPTAVPVAPAAPVAAQISTPVTAQISTPVYSSYPTYQTNVPYDSYPRNPTYATYSEYPVSTATSSASAAVPAASAVSVATSQITGSRPYEEEVQTSTTSVTSTTSAIPSASAVSTASTTTQVTSVPKHYPSNTNVYSVVQPEPYLVQTPVVETYSSTLPVVQEACSQSVPEPYSPPAAVPPYVSYYTPAQTTQYASAAPVITSSCVNPTPIVVTKSVKDCESPPPPPPESPCCHSSSTESHKSKGHESSKGKGKLGKLLSPRHITPRSVGSECVTYPQSQVYTTELKVPGVQVVQVNVPSISPQSQVPQIITTNAGQLSPPCVFTNPIRQSNSNILPTIINAANQIPSQVTVQSTVAGYPSIISQNGYTYSQNIKLNESPLEKLRSTAPAVGEVVSEVASLITPDSRNSESPLEKLGSTASAVGDAVSGVASLITPDSVNVPVVHGYNAVQYNQAPSYELGYVPISNGYNAIPKNESPLEKLGSTASAVGDAISGVASLITPDTANAPATNGYIISTNQAPTYELGYVPVSNGYDSIPQNESPLEKLGSTAFAVGDAVSGVASLITPDSRNNESPLEKLGSTASAVGDAVSGVTSLITPDTINAPPTNGYIISTNEAPSYELGYVPIGNEKIESVAPTIGDVVYEVSSLITPNSPNTPAIQEYNTASNNKVIIQEVEYEPVNYVYNSGEPISDVAYEVDPDSSNHRSPLEKLGSTASSTLGAISGASSLLSPDSSGNGSPLEKLGSTAASAIGAVADASSLIVPDSSDGQSVLGKLGSVASAAVDTIAGASSLITPDSSGDVSPLEKLGSTAASAIGTVADASSLIIPDRSDGESPLGKLGSAASSIVDTIAGASSLITPDSSGDGSPLEKLGSTAASAIDAIAGASSLITPDAAGNGSPLVDKLGNTVSGIVDVISGASSLITPDSEGNASPLEKIGSTAASAIDALAGASSLIVPDSSGNASPLADRFGNTVSGIVDVISGASSLITPDSSGDGSPLEKLGSTAASAIDALAGASSLIVPDPSGKGSPLADRLGSTVSAVVDAISGASSLITPDSSGDPSPLEKLGSTAASAIDAIAGASSLVAPQSSSNQPCEGRKHPLEIVGTAASNIADSVVSAASLLNSHLQQRQQNRENQQYTVPDLTIPIEVVGSTTSAIADSLGSVASSVASQIPHNTNPLGLAGSAASTIANVASATASVPESAASALANSVSTMVNSAASVANSLSSAISQLTSQRIPLPELPSILPSPPTVTYVAPPPSLPAIAPAIQAPSLSLPQNHFFYRPTSQFGNQGETQFSLTLPRDKLSSAVNGGVFLPGDIISIALNQQAALIGNVIDFVSPITFGLVKRNNWDYIPPQGQHMWSISSNECRDRELQSLLQQVSRSIIV